MPALEDGIPARRADFDERLIEMINDLLLMTMNKPLYCCIVTHDDLEEDDFHVKTAQALVLYDGSGVFDISRKLESEISHLDSSVDNIRVP